MPTVLVAGASGIVGRHAAAAFATTPGWRVVTAGRRPTPPELVGLVDEHLAVDLLDPVDAVDTIGRRPDVTHLVFAALADRPSSQARLEANVALLANTLEAFRQSSSRLQHVVAYQSPAVYGAHLGSYPIPARESDPRLPVPSYEDEQADLLVDAGTADGFRWTILRPDTVIGQPTGIVLVLAAYAAVCRARGLPLRFPGTDAQFRSLAQVTDAELLARATVWAATSEAAGEEVFNVTNGDAFRWCDLWPRVASAFGVEVAAPTPFSLTEAMAANADVWDWLVDQYDLVPTKWDRLVDWGYGDEILGAGCDRLYSTVKVRRAGFGDACDSVERVLSWFERLATARVIPPLGL